MVLNVSTIGDNPQQPGVFAETFVPDQLIVGKLVTQPIVIAEGALPLPRGMVLGQQSNVTVESAVGANNGNGTIGALSAGTGVEIGTYTLTATGATTFTVATPERVDLANATLGMAYAKGGIGFTITGGGAAFCAGDSFAVRRPSEKSCQRPNIGKVAI
jgi:hypothetical protein